MGTLEDCYLELDVRCLPSDELLLLRYVLGTGKKTIHMTWINKWNLLGSRSKHYKNFISSVTSVMGLGMKSLLRTDDSLSEFTANFVCIFSKDGEEKTSVIFKGATKSF